MYTCSIKVDETLSIKGILPVFIYVFQSIIKLKVKKMILFRNRILKWMNEKKCTDINIQWIKTSTIKYKHQLINLILYRGKHVILFVLITTIGKGFCQSQVNIEQLLEKENIPGAVWTLVKNDSIFTYCSGIKNINSGEKLKLDDQVHIGSITKTILALGI
jgi:predicted small secreted protein